MEKGAAGAAGRSPQDFQASLTGLIAEARVFAVAEDDESISVLLNNGLPKFRRLAAEALAVLEDIETIASSAAGGRVDVRRGWSRGTGTLILPAAFEELADLCFIGASECRACRNELEALSSSSDPFTLLVVIERTQMRLSSSLCAVEARLANMSGRESKTRHVELGRKSLQSRHLLARLRRRMAGAACHDDMEQRLRSSAGIFAWLTGHDHFSHLRASDRLTARQLQRRILDWLRTRSPPGDDNRHLWQDVRAFVELVQLVNCRPEIVQHDFRIVLQVMSVLADMDPEGALPRSVAGRLNSILGRDELLDELLTGDVDTARVLARLFDIYAVLERECAGQLRGPDAAPPPYGRERREKDMSSQN